MRRNELSGLLQTHKTHSTWRHIYTTRILISAPVINPLVRIKCMTGKRRRAVKEREGRRKMCNGRRLRCGKCLIHGGAVQYVVHNTIFTALHQWTIFQNILECIHHLLSDYIMSTEQFLCRSITIIIPQSASEWCWRIWCRVVSLYVALEGIKDCNDINLKTVVLTFFLSLKCFFVFHSFTTPAQDNIGFTYKKQCNLYETANTKQVNAGNFVFLILRNHFVCWLNVYF